jgi:hypothetical protein
MVFLRMGSSEYKNSAIKDGAKPRPTSGMKIVKRARDGKVKKTDVTARDNSRARTFLRVAIPRLIENTLARPRTLTT